MDTVVREGSRRMTAVFNTRSWAPGRARYQNGLTDRQTGLRRWTAQSHSASPTLPIIVLPWSFIFLKAKLYNQLSGRFVAVDRNFGCPFCTQVGAHKKKFSFIWQYVKHAMQMSTSIHNFLLPFCARNKLCNFKSTHVAVCQGQIHEYTRLYRRV